MTNYKKAIEAVIQRRKNDILLNEYRIIKALKQDEDLHKLDVLIRTMQQQKRHGENIDDDLLAKLTKNREQMFKKLGLSDFPPFRCNLCRDTGLIENKPCACIVSNSLKNEANKVSFDESDIGVFDKADQAEAQKVYAVMTKFCDKFPDTNIKNIILSGGTGTGKTFLASCIASKISENGFSVLFLSSFAFVNQMLGFHTAQMDEKLDYLSPVIDCDLLVIDDLGTESILKNVTVEYLYSVINERIRLKRHTVITTNFDGDMLLSRYGERLYSRLFDKRLSAGFVLANHDIRTRL